MNRLVAWTELAEKLEWRKQEAKNQAQSARELVRRQNLKKTRGQKKKMVQGKRHRAGIKQKRSGGWEE
jgi:hypothetical protein